MAVDEWVFIFAGFVPGRFGCESRQILSSSSSSQIPGTCDSQACCYCGNINLGIKCVRFLDDIVGLSLNTISLIILVTGICGFIVTIVVYIRIYLIVRRHKNQIQSLQGFEISQSFERTKFTCILKSTVGVFYVYLVFLASYLPYAVCLILMGINGSIIAPKKSCSLFNDSHISEFISEPCNLLLEDETHSTRHSRYAEEHVVGKNPCLT